MKMKELLDKVVQMMVLHVIHRFATGNGHMVAFDLQEWQARGVGDGEAVAREGHDLFSEDQRLGHLCDIVLKDADGLRDRVELMMKHDERLKIEVLSLVGGRRCSD